MAQERFEKTSAKRALDLYRSFILNESLKDKIADRLDIEADTIEVEATSYTKYRPEEIEYTVKVPMNDVVPMAKLFGISEDENKATLIVEGSVCSERLKP